jgi:uncharacterized protein
VSTKRSIRDYLFVGSLLLNIVLAAALLARGRHGSTSPEKNAAQNDVDHLLLQVQCGKGDKQACADVERIDQTECAGGRGHACTLLAIKFDNKKEETKAAEMYVKACDLGDGSGCWYAGSRYVEGRGVPKDVLRGIELLEKACAKDEKNGCLDLGSAYARHLTPPDEAKALAAWDKGCGLGYDWCCNRAKELRAKPPK